ncbi:nuclear transport factor 2 family protein [Poritiphilus flavus]|uniref:SnoaL-like domain-containing protein n=1 Tax=Poritiphilus flavus TaxID=2697053 RepID=A0A6L9EGB6_9FLAO|nr:nuclear transport factor 2 family protein [Poritiphilus flavus]NAS13558.1 hypothetical protein [Poritiphilus flavus]
MRSLFAIALSICLFSCSSPQKEKPLDKEAVTAEVRQMLKDYHAAMAEGGLLAEFDYLDESEDFFWVPPGYSSALTYDSVRTILEQNAKTLDKIKLEWESLQVLPLSSTLANYTGIVRSTSKDTAGIQTTVAIIESGTLIKRSDGWKLLSGQSALLPETSDN